MLLILERLRTYTLYKKSREITMKGTSSAENQKTALEKIWSPWPAIISGERTRTDGQNLLSIRTYMSQRKPLPTFDSQFQNVHVDVSSEIFSRTVTTTFVYTKFPI